MADSDGIKRVTLTAQVVNQTLLDADGKQGVGKNRRTAKFVIGGALPGTVLGAAAGGAAGAGTQVLTRGGSVRIPAESVLTFRLDQPLGVQGTH